VQSEEAQGTPSLEPPRGMYPSRLDDKGRLKLPVPFQQYFGSLPDRKLFVTSLDRRTAQIYTMPVWRENERFFETYTENPRVAKNVAFNANDLGADAEMDAQGRILFPPELRRELGLENAPVRLYAYKSRIEVLSEGIYQHRKQLASQTPEDAVDLLERAGLK